MSWFHVVCYCGAESKVRAENVTAFWAWLISHGWNLDTRPGFYGHFVCSRACEEADERACKVEQETRAMRRSQGRT